MKTLPKTPQIFYKKQILILFSAILLLPILGNLLRPGFFATDDGDWMIIRFSAFHQEFVHGQIPVRFLQRLNNNYGYPVATFLYPGFMYLSEIPKLIGLGFIDSIKITLVASVIAAFCFSFFFLRKIFDDTSAILGAFLYIYSPYFLWDIYKRGSVGEVLALAVVPFIFWAIKTKKISFTSLGYGMLIISHNTMAFISIPILLLFQFFIDREYSSITPKTLFNILKPLLLGLSLAAFFWIPALLELKYTVFEKVDVSRWEEYFIDLSNIPLIGVANLLVFLVSVFVVLKFRNFTDKKFLLFICAFLISLFLFSPLSSLLWRFFPLGKTVQFPFRFLSLIVISSSYLLAYNFHFFFNGRNIRIKIIFATLVLAFVIASGLSFAKPKEFIERDDLFYSTNEATTTISNEYMPIWVEEDPAKRADKLIERIDEDLVRVNKIYWPGWKIYIDGQTQPISYENKNGLMQISTKASLDKIRPVFSETPFRLFCDFWSLGTFFFLVYLYVKRQA